MLESVKVRFKYLLLFVMNRKYTSGTWDWKCGVENGERTAESKKHSANPSDSTLLFFSLIYYVFFCVYAAVCVLAHESLVWAHII